MPKVADEEQQQQQRQQQGGENEVEELELAVGVQLLVHAVATWWVCQLSTRQQPQQLMMDVDYDGRSCGSSNCCRTEQQQLATGSNWQQQAAICCFLWAID